LHYNYHRYYEPQTGRYLSPDPIGLEGGTRSYAYVHNPLVWIDPFGLAGDPATATHVTYLGADSATGKPYVGYASMQGVQTPEDVISYRYGGDFGRFGGSAPDPIYSGYGQDGKDTARGLEQRTFESRGGLDGTANLRNPVGDQNPNQARYLQAADNHLAQQNSNAQSAAGGCK
jgi:uncharacterized protein RhaS with RHS repeats